MTRRRMLTACLGLIAFLGSTRAAPAKDLSGIYSPEVLEHWKGVFTPLVEKILKDDLAPALTAQGRRELKETTIDLPTSTNTNDPFEDVTSASHTITLPVLSMKFLYDLIAAQLWLTDHGFEDRSVLYVSALKYQDSSRFPGGHYPPPLDALGVPHSRMMDPAEDVETMRKGLPQMFIGALTFILAHELHHILEPSKNLNVWVRELRADQFALLMVARAEYSPVGVFLYFLYATPWSPNAGDFPSAAAFTKWFLTAGVAHPLSGFRVETIGEQILHEPEQFLPDVDRADPRIQLMLKIGAGLVEVGKDLQNVETRSELKLVALDVDVAGLALHRKAAPSSAPTMVSPKALKPPDVSLPAATEAVDVPTASRAGNLAMLSELLAAQPALVNRKDAHGRTPLTNAVMAGRTEVVRFLLAHGGNPNEEEEKGTPFGEALAAQNTIIVKLMLAKGAKVNPEGHPNLTPLVIAVVADYEEGVRLLLAHGAAVDARVGTGVEMTALVFAADFGYTRILALLLQHGADVNAAGTDGFTALHLAAREGYEDMVETLLKRGADVNRKGAGDFTPLDFAAANNELSIAKALVAHGADVRAKNFDGETPCQTARRKQAEEVAAYLCGMTRDKP